MKTPVRKIFILAILLSGLALAGILVLFGERIFADHELHQQKQ